MKIKLELVTINQIEVSKAIKDKIIVKKKKNSNVF
jgi:hypothetical protein